MNIRTASLLTALLFLAAPLALTPVGAAVTEPYTCPAPDSPAFEEDPVFGAACAVVTQIPNSSWTKTNGVVNDLDNDGRPDSRTIPVATPVGTQSPSVGIDLFFDDSDPETADTPFEAAGGLPDGPFDIGAANSNLRGEARISNAFTNSVPFTDTTRGSNDNNAAEPYDLAVYVPGESAKFYASSSYAGDFTKTGQGICILCIDVDSARIVFSPLGSAPEGVIDLDDGDSDTSIQSNSEAAILHVRLPPPVAGREQGAAYYDGYRFQVDEAFVHDGTLDLDDDGFEDAEEQGCFSNPTNPLSTCDDMDGDGMGNDEESDNGRDPLAPDLDADGDGLIDVEDNCPANANALQTDRNNDGVGDTCDDQDGDGLTDAQELSARKSDGTASGYGATNPDDADSDDDGRGDKQEVDGITVAASDPNDSDTDNDGLSDGVEATDGTNPTLSDTDGDGLSDPAEKTATTNPKVPDSDADGRTDGQEVNRVPPTDPKDADSDDDGLNDGREHTATSDPLDADSDNDGIDDGPEVNKYGTSPTDANTDDDELTDKQEIDDNTRAIGPVPSREYIVPIQVITAPQLGELRRTEPIYVFLNPRVADTNGDGADDNAEDLGTLSMLPVQPPTGGAEQPQIPLVDEYDPHDVNSDGKGNRRNEATGKIDNGDRQANGQVDAIETSVMYYDQDEAEHDEGYDFGRFEGDNGGVTFTMYQDTNGRNPTLTVRYGDVADSDTIEVLVIEDQKNGYTVCVLNVDGKPVLYAMNLYTPEGQNYRFAPASDEPCGKAATEGEVEGIANFFGDPFYGLLLLYGDEPETPWFDVIDENGDGSPEKVSMRLPVVGLCDPFGIVAPCMPDEPMVIDLSDVAGTVDDAVGTVTGLLGDCSPTSPPSCVPDPCAIHPVPMVCAEEPPADADGDGVADDDDECSSTPAGANVNAAGCPDADDDGVADADDDCAGTAAGKTVNASGCEVTPPADADGDGVADADDDCPATPEGATVDASGCPVEAGCAEDDLECQVGELDPTAIVCGEAPVPVVCEGDGPDPTVICDTAPVPVICTEDLPVDPEDLLPDSMPGDECPQTYTSPITVCTIAGDGGPLTGLAGLPAIRIRIGGGLPGVGSVMITL